MRDLPERGETASLKRTVSVDLEAAPGALRMGLTRARIPGLDGLRGLGAVCIVLTHMKVAPFWVVLNIFFGLSGFLITWLLLEEERMRGRVSLPQFFLRRSLRIMPAYYVALLVITVLIPPSAGPLRPGHVQSAALYYSNYYQALHGSTHGALSPYWSLAVEEQFYLLWPLCFVFARRLRAHILVLVILAVWWQRAVVCWGEGDMEWAYHALDCRADHLLVGCLSALALHRGHLAPLWGALCRGSGPLWLSFGLLVALTLLPLVAGESLRVGFAFYLEPWIIAGLLIQVIAGCAEGRLAWLDGALLRWLGNRSYAIYLYHVFAMDIVGRVIDGTRLQLVVPTLLLTLVLAQASWVLIEAPIQRRRGRWLASSSALSPPPDAS